ncbi:Guanylate kinase 1 [Diplonema papillatum]|nr:Guanylate kinase 1 [Diplonema papillatum]
MGFRGKSALRVGIGFVGVLAGGSHGFSLYCTRASVTGTAQPFTGYWEDSNGTVLRLKQWGQRITGSLDADATSPTTAESKDGKLVLDGDGGVVEIDGAAYRRKHPELVVICGPSGVGKGTLLERLFAEHPGLFGFSVSHTSRQPRAGEEDGVHYYFATKEAIQKMIAAGEFIEYAEVHGNIYGTSKQAVKAVQDTGKICVLDIDVQGAQKVAQSGIPFVGIFVKPPSREELERRLRGRGTETEEKVQKRLANSAAEIAFCDTHSFFCHELVNSDLGACCKELIAAIAQGTQSPALPSVPVTTDATPLCGVKPSTA